MNGILLNRWFESLTQDRKYAITGSTSKAHNARWWNSLAMEERQSIFNKHKRVGKDLISDAPAVPPNNSYSIADYHITHRKQKKREGKKKIN